MSLHTVITPSGSFTRPADATPYASGDLVANNTVAANVVPVELPVPGDASVQVRRVRLRKSSVSVTNASFRVHLYRTLPAVANGDNGVFSPSNVAGYIGSVDVTIDKAHSDGAAGVAAVEINARPPGSLYALVEARAAYTPGNAEIFTVTLEALTR